MERGYTPLEEIKNTKQKISCIDSDGYKYYVSYDLVRDKRTKCLDKWKKQNIYKSYNMRLYANRVQENCVILSTDDELSNANDIKVKFICPRCGEEYEKKWCHWIAQPDNEHFCRKCSTKIRADKRTRTEKEVVDAYKNYGYKLLSSYQEYIDNGGNHARLSCVDKDGYKYSTSLGSLSNGNAGNNKFSTSNPFASENLQKWCDDNNVKLQVLQQLDDIHAKFEVKCSCGSTYVAEAYEIMTLGRTRCPSCSKRESRLELKTREWLEENNIPFIPEYRFDDCRDIRSLPFDFKCDWNNNIILIEVDGGQHYYVTQWTNEEILKEQKRRDNIKTKYCKDNGYILLRIPFWDFDRDTYKMKLSKTFFAQSDDLS